MGDDDGPAGGADTRLFWMEERISNAMRLKPEKLKALQANADARCASEHLRADPEWRWLGLLRAHGGVSPAHTLRLVC